MDWNPPPPSEQAKIDAGSHQHNELGDIFPPMDLDLAFSASGVPLCFWLRLRLGEFRSRSPEKIKS